MEKHIFLGLMIPVIFLAFTGVVKSLVKKDWGWYNFYLGIDIALAALANGIVNVVDGAHQVETISPGALTTAFGNQMYYTAMCILAAIGALFATMAIHQQFDTMTAAEAASHRISRGICLGIVGNLLGGAVLGMFIFMKLRRVV